MPSSTPESAVAPALATKASILPKSLMTSLTSCSTDSYLSTWHLYALAYTMSLLQPLRSHHSPLLIVSVP